MGQKKSKMSNDGAHPATLKSRSVDGLASYIKSGRVRRIVVMTGAGISTSAGIPDFRSPDTGLYANLARLNLPYPEAVFNIGFFRQNPLPFYALAHELYPGNFRPTVAHSFIRLLHEKGLLLMLFTQNIDCLDRVAGVPDDKILEAHGSFARQRCIDCRTEYPDGLMEEKVEKKEVPYCLVPQCNGLVKPDIVFFGEALPEEFFLSRSLPSISDLCIIMGTSLTVYPFGALPMMCVEETPRVLINKELVGDIGSRPDDVFLQGTCDDGVRKLADALGWREELEALWKATAPDMPDTNEPKAEEPKSKDEALADKINNLTAEVDQSLKWSEAHRERVHDELYKLEDGRRNSRETKAETGETSGLAHVFPYLMGKKSTL